MKSIALGVARGLLISISRAVVWQHIHPNGRYAFRDSGQAIDLDAIIQGLQLG